MIRYKPRWAKIVSDVLSPPVIFGLLTIILATRDTETAPERIQFFAVIFAALTIVAPIIFLVYLLRRGLITDIHTPISKERRIPLLVASVCAVSVLLIFLVMGSPKSMLMLAIFTVIANVIIGLITLNWHISVHSTVVSGATTIIGILLGVQYALLALPFALLVIAARLALRRHTVAQSWQELRSAFASAL